jgi:hypothetical protein
MENNPVAYGIAMRGLHMVLCKLPLKWQIKTEGFSADTINAKVNLPRRVKEKKTTTGGQQVADLQREMK